MVTPGGGGVDIFSCGYTLGGGGGETYLVVVTPGGGGGEVVGEVRRI